MNNTEKSNSNGKSCKDENCITVSATYGEKNEKTLTGFKTLLALNVATTALLILFFTVALFGNKAYAQDTCSEKIIIGETNLEALQQIPEFWTEYRKNYDSYSIDEKKIEEITKILNNYKSRDVYIIAVVGTWCGDTKEQLPVFQKIFDRLKHRKIRIAYIGVDRNKLAGEIDISHLNIEFVPTFIFYDNIVGDTITSRNGVLELSFIYEHFHEFDRIVETPEGRMEEHLLEILRIK